MTVQVADEQIDQLFASLGTHFVLLPSDPRAFLRETRVLPLQTANGIRVDLIRAGLPYEEAAIRRAQVHEIGGVSVAVVRPEDLVVHKLASERPRDREDALGVLRRNRGQLDRAYLDPLVASLADLFERPEIWEWYQRAVE